jgi:hypothetical protein
MRLWRWGLLEKALRLNFAYFFGVFLKRNGHVFIFRMPAGLPEPRGLSSALLLHLEQSLLLPLNLFVLFKFLILLQLLLFLNQQLRLERW